MRRSSACSALVWLAACSPSPGVTPSAGRGSGGEPIRIVGSGFREHGAAVVYVGPKAAKAVVVESDRLITVLTPEADGPGLVDVRVQFSDGEIIEYPAAYTYGDRAVVLQPREGEP